MMIYELSGVNNAFMSFRSTEEPTFMEDGSFVNDGIDIFTTDGSSKCLEWILPPHVLLESEPLNKKKFNKKNKMIPDIGHVEIGSIVFSKKVVDLIGNELTKYGELLSLDAEGTEYYFYNVTNILNVIDYTKSTLAPKGSILNPVFDFSKMPSQPQVFKIKGLEGSRIYLSDVDNKLSLVQLINEGTILGGNLKAIYGN